MLNGTKRGSTESLGELARKDSKDKLVDGNKSPRRSRKGSIGHRPLAVSVMEESSTSTLLFTPLSSKGSSRSLSSFELFNKEAATELLIRVFPQTEPQPSSPNGLLVEDDGHDPLAQDVTKLPEEFLKILKLFWQRHGTYAFWRLQDPFEVSNRRYSFVIDDEVIYSPKQTNTSTQTEPSYHATAGHCGPRDEVFRSKAYKVTDYNAAGAFPKKIADAPNNEALLIWLQQHMQSENIKVAKFFHNMICFAEEVDTYSKDLVANGRHLKHYIQECRSLSYLIDLIVSERGNFIHADTKEIIFQDPQNNICKLDLRNTHPQLSPELTTKDLSFTTFDELSAFIELHNIISYHAPLFYQPTPERTFIPVMMPSGENGYHIAGDVDPEAIFTPQDLPFEGYYSFNGKTDAADKFLIGLMLLRARLKAVNPGHYNKYLTRLKKSLNKKQLSEIIDEFIEVFAHSYISEEYIDYTRAEYYQETFLPVLEATIEFYKKNPDQLSTVGQSTIFDLVIKFDFDHELYVHGGDDINPTITLPPMGATFFYFQGTYFPDGEFISTGDEKSYIEFLIHDPEILYNSRTKIHPSRLVGAYSNDWNDIISILALNSLKKGIPHFERFQKIILANFSFRHGDCEKEATRIATELFSSLRAYIIMPEAIDNRINKIYERHAKYTNYIRSKFGKKMPVVKLQSPTITS